MIKTINRNALTYSFLEGKSIWKDANKGIMVNECQVLYSTACQAYIEHNEKATLQWKLEKQLIRFEDQYKKTLLDKKNNHHHDQI